MFEQPFQSEIAIDEVQKMIDQAVKVMKDALVYKEFDGERVILGNPNTNDFSFKYVGYTVEYGELRSLKFNYECKLDSLSNGVANRVPCVLYGNITLDINHYPDCCEINYADPTYIENKESPITQLHSNYFELELVDELGFRINTILIPCYSVQNGYYSNSIHIDIKVKDVRDHLIYQEATNLYCEMKID